MPAVGTAVVGGAVCFVIRPAHQAMGCPFLTTRCVGETDSDGHRLGGGRPTGTQPPLHQAVIDSIVEDCVTTLFSTIRNVRRLHANKGVCIRVAHLPP